jgi:hypothetical protein
VERQGAVAQRVTGFGRRHRETPHAPPRASPWRAEGCPFVTRSIHTIQPVSHGHGRGCPQSWGWFSTVWCGEEAAENGNGGDAENGNGKQRSRRGAETQRASRGWVTGGNHDPRARHALLFFITTKRDLESTGRQAASSLEHSAGMPGEALSASLRLCVNRGALGPLRASACNGMLSVPLRASPSNSAPHSSLTRTWSTRVPSMSTISRRSPRQWMQAARRGASSSRSIMKAWRVG